MVFSTSGNVSIGASYLVKTKEYSQRSFREGTSISNEQYHEVSGVENSRKNLALSEISIQLPTLSPGLGESQLRQVVNRSGEKELAGVMGRTIHFGVI